LNPVPLQWTRLPFFFDPSGLRADVQAIPPDAWIPHFNRQDYEGAWSSVALRSRSGRSEDIVPHGEAEEFGDTPFARQCPHLQAAVEAFEFPKKSVRLLRLHAGSRVREHCDRDLGLANGELRIHVPVLTNDGVEFVVANRRLILRAGESWYIDFSQPHRIHNRSSSDRIHLVIDGKANGWALALLERASREIVTETYNPAGVADLQAFCEMVYEDQELQARLLKIPDQRQFLQEVVAAAAERGCEFELAVAESALKQRTHEWLMRSVSA
jgi:hypothetical protein